MTLPNFFVVGAGRSGTTSLHRLIAQHPEIAVCSTKSPNHFAAHLQQPAWETPAAVAMAKHWITDRAEYEALFDTSHGERAVGDVSPVYLQALDVARAIHDLCPDARIVAILRDPAERAHAHFVGRRRDGIEPVATFEEKLDQELAGPLPHDVAFGHYVGCGQYHHFLQPYVERFGPDRVRIYLYDDLVADEAGLLRDLFGFLEVDPTFEPTSVERMNRSGEIRNPVLRKVWTGTVRLRTAVRPHVPVRLRRAVGRQFLTDLDKPPLDPASRARIVDVLEPELLALEGLLERDLSAWRAR